MNQCCFFRLSALFCCLFVVVSLSAADANRIYFNGEQAVEFYDSPDWWLLDAQSFNRDNLARLDLKGIDLAWLNP